MHLLELTVYVHISYWVIINNNLFGNNIKYKLLSLIWNDCFWYLLIYILSEIFSIYYRFNIIKNAHGGFESEDPHGYAIMFK